MTQSNSITELASALAKFQSEVGNVTRDSVNPFFKSKYASLENVISTVKPILSKWGLSYAQFPDEDGLTTILMHSSGEFIQASAKLLMKDATPQGHGSAITYLRRYALSAILGIATEDDDDGNAATPQKTPVTAAQKPREAKVAPPKSIGDKRAAMENRITELCQLIDGVPFMMVDEVEKSVMEHTGLEFKPENYMEIGLKLAEINKKNGNK